MLRDSSSERAWARRDQPWSWHWVMSFLTTFPEDVYPTHRLAETIRRDTFDIELAQALMWMSQAAYETTADRSQDGRKRKLERILDRWGFACRARLSQGGTEGFVAESEAAIVVAFAGTDPVVAANWITDFNIRTGPRRHPPRLRRRRRGHLARPGRGARGYLQTHLPRRPQPRRCAGRRGCLAPHRRRSGSARTRSRRGGGIDVERIAGVLTFGMPRAGDEAFAAAYKSRGLWQKIGPPRIWQRHRPVASSRRSRATRLSPRRPGAALPARRAIQGLAAAARRSRRADDPGTSGGTARHHRQRDVPPVRRGLASHPGPWGSALAGRRHSHADHRQAALFLRDHLQDCYLEALGWSFTRPSASRVSISAEDADSFAHASEAHIEEAGRDLPALLRRLFVGG